MKHFKILAGNGFPGKILNDSLLENESACHPMTSGALSIVIYEISGLLFLEL